MTEIYPPIEPYAAGMLDVGDGNAVHWTASGNPDGKPALVVHGGPGSGSSPGARRLLDPARYRIVQFDQRGCGRSTPHAADPATDMRHNTTRHLIADMEQLRDHLGIDRWLLHGGSWGSTLILAYAQQHPERVSEIVIAAVTMTRRSEIDWLYRGVGRFFPEQWERFLAAAPGTPRDGDIVGAYARLSEDPDARVREKATADWCAWEDAVLSGETGGASNPYSDRPSAARQAFVRICARYFAHGAWLDEGALLRDAGRLTGIPGVLVHGRLDMGGPLITAWELHRAWPGSELIVVESAGHLGSPTTRDHVLRALDRFAALP
ncbi:prolyl aminopeptidase [Actinoplanes sp. NBRC 101535]|uniref:prolyl aminopeptidase n=1 Tax=Actinoplanes sp. NBRC 101535 TaxID=3032196 RepID=UPI0024A2FC32|nr:prolyl aminopeptidase [Actinoplanes sp. NBRC 101535]GLY06978.1 proline iminopeptidase [Actinoplanes sp. NBRC 101535]